MNKYSINTEITSWKELDGEAVIINFENTYYYSLNATGTYIWNLLLRKDLSADEITQEVSTHFNESVNNVKDDVGVLLKDLFEENLILKI